MLDFLRRLLFGGYEIKIAELEKKTDECLKINNSLKTEIFDLNTELDSFKLPSTLPPLWLNEDAQAYAPPIVYLLATGTDFTVTLKPQDIYTTSMSLEKLVKEKGWQKLTLNKKLKEIWYFVIQHMTYAYDKGDAWQFPVTTYFRKQGDCEDGTVLFVALCRIAGVPADKFFNACGWFNDGKSKFGHSYPVAQMEDGLWYIFETTLDTKPAHPLRWKGSPYTADWGVANHLYSGGIKNGETQI